MASGDFPQITNSGYASNDLSLGAFTVGGGNDFLSAIEESSRRMLSHPLHFGSHQTTAIQPQQTTPMPSDKPQRRIVQIFIADTDENVPLAESVIYTGEQKLTDSSDQELYFEINLMPLLETYNKKRVTWLDKEASKRAGKDIFLEAVRIRDLKMVVVDIAKF